MKLLEKAQDIWEQNDTKFLTGAAVVGSIATPVLASRATLKAKDIIEASTADIWYKDSVTFGKVTKAYIPTVISGSITIGCIISCEKINLAKIGELTLATTVLTDRIQQLEDFYVATQSTKHVAEYNAGHDKDHIKPDGEQVKVVAINADSRFWIWDPIAGDYINTSANELAAAMLRVNYLFTETGYRRKPASWNMFRQYLNAKPCDGGDDIGWSQDDEDLVDEMGFCGDFMLECEVTGPEGVDPVVLDDGTQIFAMNLVFNHGPRDIRDETLYYKKD